MHIHWEKSAESAPGIPGGRVPPSTFVIEQPVIIPRTPVPHLHHQPREFYCYKLVLLGTFPHPEPAGSSSFRGARWLLAPSVLGQPALSWMHAAEVTFCLHSGAGCALPTSPVCAFSNRSFTAIGGRGLPGLGFLYLEGDGEAFIPLPGITSFPPGSSPLHCSFSKANTSQEVALLFFFSPYEALFLKASFNCKSSSVHGGRKSGLLGERTE